MASLKEIKGRIASVRTTLKITSAMKMVASAKLHKAQQAIGNMLPYEKQLHRMLVDLISAAVFPEALAVAGDIAQVGAVRGVRRVKQLNQPVLPVNEFT